MRSSGLRRPRLASFAQASVCSKVSRRLASEFTEHPVKVGEGLEAYRVGDLADSQMRVYEFRATEPLNEHGICIHKRSLLKGVQVVNPAARRSVRLI